MTNEEKKEFLETYKWIVLKEPRPKERSRNEFHVDWKKEYFDLLIHHKEETEFLIQTVRQLVQYIDQQDADMRECGVYKTEDLSQSFLDSVNGKFKPISDEERERIKKNYEMIQKITKGE